MSTINILNKSETGIISLPYSTYNSLKKMMNSDSWFSDLEVLLHIGERQEYPSPLITFAFDLLYIF